jgi:hypothetical protein
MSELNHKYPIKLVDVIWEDMLCEYLPDVQILGQYRN